MNYHDNGIFSRGNHIFLLDISLFQKYLFSVLSTYSSFSHFRQSIGCNIKSSILYVTYWFSLDKSDCRYFCKVAISSYRTVPAYYRNYFSSFSYFRTYFTNLQTNEVMRKWETRKIFANNARGNAREQFYP